MPVLSLQVPENELRNATCVYWLWHSIYQRNEDLFPPPPCRETRLRTIFVEGISVTLKSRLRVTQGHWKRNHWVDHTRLTISRVFDVEYYRDHEMWVRGERSLTMCH